MCADWTRPQGAPLLVAHRGLSSRAPENTLAAVDLALEAGIPMVEIDVQLSADDRAVVHHDRTLQRTTTGDGVVRRYSCDELRQFDAGSWFDPAFAGERIPLLADVLRRVAGRALLNIELKSFPFLRTDARTFARTVLDDVDACGMRQSVLITSFDLELLALVRALDGEADLGVLYGGLPHLLRTPSDLARTCRARAFICARREFRRGFVADAHAAGIALFVYTVNDPDEARRFADMGVDGIISDAPDRLHDTVRGRH